MARAEQPAKSDNSHHKTISEMMADTALVTEAIRAGAREARRLHILHRQPMVGMQDGKIVWTSPEELEAMEAQSDEPV